MKKIILFNLLFFMVYISFSQNEKVIDSLKKELSNTKKPINEAKIYYNLGLEYRSTNTNNSKKYFNKAEKKLIKINKTDILFIKIYNAKASLFTKINEYDKSDSLFDLSVKYTRKLKTNQLYFVLTSLNGKNINNYYRGDNEKYFNVLSNLVNKSEKLDTTIIDNLKLKYSIIKNKGISLAGKSKFNEALLCFKKDLEFRKKMYKLNDTQSKNNLINSLNNVAICYTSLKEPEKSLKIYFEALAIEKKNPSEKINLLYGNISNLFLNQDENERAIKYASLINSERLGYNFTKFNNIGVAYLKLKNHKKSLFYFLRANKSVLKMNRKDNTAKLYRNLGFNYIELKKLDSSLFFLNKSKGIYTELKWFEETASINYLIGKVYFIKNKFNKALYYMINADKKFKEIGNVNETYIWNTENLYKIYKEKNDLNKSLYWLENLNKLNIEYNLNKNKDKVTELEIKYQTQQKETKILTLQNENIKKEAKLTKSKYTIYAILSTLLLVLGLTYFFWHKRKQQQKLALLENTVKISEQEKQRIGKELHDGIAGSIIKLVYETEGTQLELSDKLLKTYNEVRTLSHQLDNTTIHNELFMDRVLELVPIDFKDKMFSISINPNHLKLEEPYGTHIYRIIQELITNNLKYAKATKTTFKLTKKGKTLEFVYKDDGIGIKKLKKGNGFKNIEDRIELMKGKIDLNIKKEKGIEMTFTIPYKSKTKLI